MGNPDLNRIIEIIKSGRCIAFLGAGCSMSYKDRDGKEVPGLPSGGSLAESLAMQCGYKNGNGYDLAKVAEYFLYVKSGNREELEKQLGNEICRINQPRPIHTALAQLNSIKVVLTSNYDTLLEMELKKYQRKLKTHHHDPQNSQTARFDGDIYFETNDVVLHKMHGTIDEPRSMVVTQSDYIRYLTNLNDADRGMPEYFRKTMIPRHTLLFLGYSLEDWNFRVIWEGVISQYRNSGVQRESYAIVQDPKDFQVKFWMRRNIEVINYDLTEFSKKLAEHFDLELPQLGIEKKQKAGNP